MNETKFYKSGRIYYKVTDRTEKVYAYRHCFAVENSNQIFVYEDSDSTQITEPQYNRVKKLILKKLLS